MDGIVTHAEAVATLPQGVGCEISGGHQWDVYNSDLIKRNGRGSAGFPKTECLSCGLMKDNPLYQPIKCQIINPPD